ncbi:Inactive protein RESTRICTED TEV MOVEMENT like [Actinidia chinensis var. chinensis]|uniref:Inactive protein RESTRICTED TEV MOVEMENT like n=1 Tax=Actinidia chinensis var. chinensis TaxID=1590841 RepID=A0A2R6PRW0_ACTCC|nr:Inactive protein RESTRICTED TEV MOVEMENT like [Actinidia chinensis var. chinensis]
MARRKQAADSVFEEIVPSSAWTEDSSCHILLVDLPGFKKEWLKLQVDDHGQLLVSGQRQASEKKIVHFEQTYKVPENSDPEKTSGKFESEVLYVIVPKQVKEEEREIQNRPANIVEEKHENDQQNKNDENTRAANDKGFQEATRKTRWNESGLLGSVVEVLSKNKGIVVTAVLAFSVGVLVCQRCQSNIGTDQGEFSSA